MTDKTRRETFIAVGSAIIACLLTTLSFVVGADMHLGRKVDEKLIPVQLMIQGDREDIESNKTSIKDIAPMKADIALIKQDVGYIKAEVGKISRKIEGP